MFTMIAAMNARISKRLSVALKIFALLLALPAAVLLARGLVHGFDPDLIWLQLALATVVTLCAGLFFCSHNVGGRTMVLFSLAGAVVLGGIGFVAGFWHPELFGSRGNLAPLMGVFVTGPVGFVCGALVGITLGVHCIHSQQLTEQERESRNARMGTTTNLEVEYESETNRN